MSSAVQIPPPKVSLATLPIDQKRGIWAMWCTIATEAMLFICMFGAYYYLGSNKDRWANENAPHLHWAFILLAILVSSSFVLRWGEKQVKAERFAAGAMALWITVFMGIVFLAWPGRRVPGPLGRPRALQRQLRLHFLHHHFAACRTRHRWSSAADLRRRRATLCQGIAFTAQSV